MPRKGVQEIMRLMPADDNPVTIQFGANHIRISDAEFTFTSKLVDGRFLIIAAFYLVGVTRLLLQIGSGYAMRCTECLSCLMKSFVVCA